MKYTISEAAKLVGVARQTLYRHVTEKPISTELDDNDNQVIDGSELVRVYGDKINFKALTEDSKESLNDNKKLQNVTPKVTEEDTPSLSKEQIIRLEAQLEAEQGLLKRIEEENDYLKSQLADEKAERRSTMALLEDQRSKVDKTSEWERTLKALEQRIANQEKAAKVKEEREQKILSEHERLKKAYAQRKRELEEEKSKGFFKKLFG